MEKSEKREDKNFEVSSNYQLCLEPSQPFTSSSSQPRIDYSTPCQGQWSSERSCDLPKTRGINTVVRTVILAFGKLRYDGCCEYQANLGDTVKPTYKNKFINTRVREEPGICTIERRFHCPYYFIHHSQQGNEELDHRRQSGKKVERWAGLCRIQPRGQHRKTIKVPCSFACCLRQAPNLSVWRSEKASSG